MRSVQEGDRRVSRRNLFEAPIRRLFTSHAYDGIDGPQANGNLLADLRLPRRELLLGSLPTALALNELLQGAETQPKPTPTEAKPAATPTAQARRRPDTLLSRALGDQATEIPNSFEFALVRYEFDSGVSQLDRLLAFYGGVITEWYMINHFYRIPQGVTINLTTSPSPGNYMAESGRGRAIVYTTYPSWVNSHPLKRIRIVGHEFHHTLQREIDNVHQEPIWLREGSADLVAYNGLAFIGAISLDNNRACHISRIKTGTPPPLLQTLETRDGFNSSQGHYDSLSVLAVQRLTERKGIYSLITYQFLLANNVPWQNAFQLSFGIDLPTFYQQFEQWRQNSSTPPTNPLCSIM